MNRKIMHGKSNNGDSSDVELVVGEESNLKTSGSQ